MQYLASWIEQLILLVLFATFVDLLLPTTGLQRYVRFILALIILVTMLSPILGLLSNEFSLQSITEKLIMLPLQQNNQSMKELEQAQQRLVNIQEDLIHQEFLLRVQENVRQQVELQFPVSVASIQVHWRKTEGDSLVITGMNVRVAEGNAVRSERGKAGTASSQADQTVHVVQAVNVDPVQIKPISVGDEQTSNESSGQKLSPDAVNINTISQFLSQQWGLAQETIQIDWIK